MDYTKLADAVVIHPPGDDSTHFLHPIYSRWPANAVEAEDVILLEYLSNLRVIAMGHGGPEGLYDANFTCVLHAGHAEALRKGSNNIFIWCYASDFMRDNGIKGFATGMFISERPEAEYLGVSATDDEINVSNRLFASILGDCLNLTSVVIHDRVMTKYDIPENNVVEYNRVRMYLAN